MDYATSQAGDVHESAKAETRSRARRIEPSNHDKADNLDNELLHLTIAGAGSFAHCRLRSTFHKPGILIFHPHLTIAGAGGFSHYRLRSTFDGLGTSIFPVHPNGRVLKISLAAALNLPIVNNPTPFS